MPATRAERPAPEPPTHITDHARWIIGGTALAGLALTLVLNLVGSLTPAFQNRSLHAAKETAAALVLLLVAALVLGRFRRSGRLLELLALAGVVVLAGKNLIFSVLTAILTETSGAFTTWRTTGAGMVGAGLLAASALSPERVLTNQTRALATAAGACVGALAILLIFAELFELPAAFTDEPETRADVRLLIQDPALVVADLGASALFLIAGVAFGRRARRECDEFLLWLGIGATIAGIAYLNYALFPSAFTDFLYVGDLFRITAVLAWGIGTIRVIAAYQAAEARAAVLDERRRLARDIHDGVAQELAFIASQMPGLPHDPAHEPITSEIMDSVHRALDETRSAISALGRPVLEPLHLALAHTAEEVAKRLGASVELDIDPRVTVSPAWEEALPRIVREAVSNAVRHGNARTVTVRFRQADGVWLRISDDGDGFDPSDRRSDTGFGLIGMRERTEGLGGEFRLTSQPGHGTTVEVLLP
jgi:signal transduction histidine kinase